MGHYDECREENCGICGQLKGFCEHTNNKLKERIKPKDMYVNNFKENNCTNCQKNEVCKWKGRYEEYVDYTNSHIPEELKSFVRNEITCNYYLSKPKEGIR